MTIELSDDGTMDTVLRCTECGEEFRFNFEPAPEEEGIDGPYEAWVESCIEEITEEHECAFNAERDCDED